MLQENEMPFLTSQEDSFLEEKSQVTQVLVAQLSQTLRPHGLQLLCPWDFPGKNAGVGCHFLLQGIFLTQGLSPLSPALQADSLPSELPGKPKGPSLLLEWQSHSRKAASVSPKKRHFAL